MSHCLATIDYNGLGALITALSTFLAVVFTGVFTFLNYRKSTHITNAVNTLNEKTIGQLAADDETRRVKDLPYEDRTSIEQRHLNEAPPWPPKQGKPD